MISSPSGSPMILVFWCQMSSQNSKISDGSTAERMKIDQYCQRQRCKHVELEQFFGACLSATAGLSCARCFMRIATGPPVGPIIVVNGLNDAFWWHSHSLYGLVKKNWNLPPLAPKIWKFALRPMANLKSHSWETVRDTCKILHQTGVFGVGHSNGVIPIFAILTLATTVTKLLNFNTKLAITHLVYEISSRFLL